MFTKFNTGVNYREEQPYIYPYPIPEYPVCIPMCHLFTMYMIINRLQMEQRLLYLKTQLLPHIKHFSTLFLYL